MYNFQWKENHLILSRSYDICCMQLFTIYIFQDNKVGLQLPYNAQYVGLKHPVLYSIFLDVSWKACSGQISLQPLKSALDYIETLQEDNG